MSLKGNMLRKLFVLVLSVLLVAMSGVYGKKTKPNDTPGKKIKNHPGIKGADFKRTGRHIRYDGI
jgi:hypothetical protein